jgi:AraC-like DNA-binding protein
LPHQNDISMKRYQPFPALLTLLLCLAACHRPAALSPAQAAYYADTLLRLQRTAFSQPDECLRQAKLIGNEGNAPAFKVNWVIGTAYQVQQKHLLAIHYFEQAFATDSVQQNPRHYINLSRNLTDEYIQLNRYEDALRHVRLMLQKSDELENPDNGRQIVYQYLTNIYFRTGDSQSGIRAARTALALGQQKVEQRQSSGEGYVARALYDLACMRATLVKETLKAGDLETAAGNLDTLSVITHRLHDMELTPQRPDGIPRKVLDALQYDVYSYKSTLCRLQGQSNEARQWAQRLSQPADEGDPYARGHLISLYLENQMPAAALPLLETQLQQDNHLDSFSENTRNTYRQLAEALRTTGHQQQAWECYDRAALITDTLNYRRRESESMQTAALYENEEKAMRIAAQQEELAQQRIIMGTLGIALLLLFACIYLGYRNLKAKRRSNRTMAERIQENRLTIRNQETRIADQEKCIAEQEKCIAEQEMRFAEQEQKNQALEKRTVDLLQALKRRPLPPPGTTPVTPATEIPIQRKHLTRNAPELFTRLEKLLKEEQLFKEPNLRREHLLTRLQTNKDTLSDTVQAYTGMSLVNYIQHVRLDHAISLLENTDEIIANIATASGFTSTRGMQRAFQEKYNMSPTEYRKIQREKK